MKQSTKPVSGAARLERELARERQQHAANQESKTGAHTYETERIKDARENFESTKVRR